MAVDTVGQHYVPLRSDAIQLYRWPPREWMYLKVPCPGLGRATLNQYRLRVGQAVARFSYSMYGRAWRDTIMRDARKS